MRSFWVYILASPSRRLYIGMTNDLRRRVVEHKAGVGSKHTAKYQIRQLVYAEEHPDAPSAIRREKALKGWRRSRKLELIERSNLGWVDLAARLDKEAESVGRERAGTAARNVSPSEIRPDPSLRSG